MKNANSTNKNLKQCNELQITLNELFTTNEDFENELRERKRQIDNKEEIIKSLKE